MRFSEKLERNEILPEFISAALVNLLGSKEFFNRESILSFLRNLRRNSGVYLGRTVFDAVQNLTDRNDALEIREYFDRSNEWERRRIIKLMAQALPDQEYNAWRRAIRTYIVEDPFVAAI